MNRARTAIAIVAGLLLVGVSAQAEPSAPADEPHCSTVLPQTGLAYRPQPEPRRGFDRVRRAVPPRVSIDAGQGHDWRWAIPDGVYVDPWRRRPPRRR